MWYVYVLYDPLTKDCYTGLTENLERRHTEHRTGKTKTTSRMHEQELIYFEACMDKKDAQSRELQLKTGFGRGYIKRRLQNYFMGR